MGDGVALRKASHIKFWVIGHRKKKAFQAEKQSTPYKGNAYWLPQIRARAVPSRFGVHGGDR